jgi:glycosyltransferase involved in cell wall biosynthesis
MAALLARRLRVPWLAVGHGTEFLARAPLVRRLNGWAIRRASAVVAVSDYTAGLIRELAAPRRMVVIPNAADGERFRAGLDTAEWRAELGLGQARVLLTIGNVTERKAQDVVIRALPRVLDEFPDLAYVIGGLPTRRAEFEQLAQTLGVAAHVHFLGMVADERLPQLYNLADLFVLVSRRAADGDVEGYGIVVQEAALCGRPAVVSKECGLEEAIQAGVTGVSVPPDDPQATAEAILELLRDDTRRQLMGKQARQVAQQATWAQRIAVYDAVLRELLSLRPQTADGRPQTEERRSAVCRQRSI